MMIIFPKWGDPQLTPLKMRTRDEGWLYYLLVCASESAIEKDVSSKKWFQ